MHDAYGQWRHRKVWISMEFHCFLAKVKIRDFDKVWALFFFTVMKCWDKLLCDCDEACVVFARCYRLAAWVRSRCHAVSVLCRYSLSKMLSSFSEWICVPGPTNRVICPTACTFLQEERCGLICLFLDALMLCSFGCGWCWFVMREQYCWLVGSWWLVLI